MQVRNRANPSVTPLVTHLSFDVIWTKFLVTTNITRLGYVEIHRNHQHSLPWSLKPVFAPVFLPPQPPVCHGTYFFRRRTNQSKCRVYGCGSPAHWGCDQGARALTRKTSSWCTGVLYTDVSFQDVRVFGYQ